MRSRPNYFEGWIGLLKAGAKEIVGIGYIHPSLEPRTSESLLAKDDYTHHFVDYDLMPSLTRWRYPWPITQAECLSQPIPVTYPVGPVIWVTQFTAH